jgi:hypothetical protein
LPGKSPSRTQHQRRFAGAEEPSDYHHARHQRVPCLSFWINFIRAFC